MAGKTLTAWIKLLRRCVYNLLISICYIRMIPKSQYVISRGLPNLSHLFWPWLRIQWWRCSCCWYNPKKTITQLHGDVKRHEVTVWGMEVGTNLPVRSNPDAVIMLRQLFLLRSTCGRNSRLLSPYILTYQWRLCTQMREYKYTNTQSLDLSLIAFWSYELSTGMFPPENSS